MFFSQSKCYVQTVLHTQTDTTDVDTAELSKQNKKKRKKFPNQLSVVLIANRSVW